MSNRVHVTEFFDKTERVFLKTFHEKLRQGFVIDTPEDETSAQMACIYFLSLIRAIRSGNTETFNKIELLLSNHISALKTTKYKRTNDTVKIQTSPATWAVNLLAEAEALQRRWEDIDWEQRTLRIAKAKGWRG